jgi:hypothetical protein
MARKTAAAALFVTLAQVHAQPVDLRTESGLHIAVFNVPQGQIRINVPDDMAGGETISGTAFAKPAGGGSGAEERNSSALSEYSIEVDGQIHPISGKRFRWRLPVAKVASVLLRDPQKKVVARCAIPLDSTTELLRPVTSADQFDLPRGGQAGSVISVRGPFGGDFGSTTVQVGGSAAVLVAESPRKVVFIAPPAVVGPSTIELTEGSILAKGVFYSLGLHVTAAKTELERGEKAVLTASVSGLQNLKEPAYLTISNQTPEMVTIEGGLVQHVVIRPGDIDPSGTFRLTRTLTGVHHAPFEIHVLATLEPTSLMLVERTAQHAVDSWSRANVIAVSGEARALIAASVAQARSPLNDFLREQQAFRADPGIASRLHGARLLL